MPYVVAAQVLHTICRNIDAVASHRWQPTCHLKEAQKYTAADEQLPGNGIVLHKILLLQSKPVLVSSLPSVACGWKHTVRVAHTTHVALGTS